MKINNQEINIDSAIKYSNYEDYLLKHRNNGLLLSDHQVDILKKCGFDINNYVDMKLLLFDIEEKLNDEYDDELDLISNQLSEFIYYYQTKK